MAYADVSVANAHSNTSPQNTFAGTVYNFMSMGASGDDYAVSQDPYVPTTATSAQGGPAQSNVAGSGATSSAIADDKKWWIIGGAIAAAGIAIAIVLYVKD